MPDKQGKRGEEKIVVLCPHCKRRCIVHIEKRVVKITDDKELKGE